MEIIRVRRGLSLPDIIGIFLAPGRRLASSVLCILAKLSSLLETILALHFVFGLRLLNLQVVKQVS